MYDEQGSRQPLLAFEAWGLPAQQAAAGDSQYL
jgi:hypothetical protein